MVESEIDTIPADFELLPTGIGFTDVLQPCFRRIDGDKSALGLRVESHHCNFMGICHGGVIMTLADIAASIGVNTTMGRTSGSPTINLSVDFISAGRLGQWLQTDIVDSSIKRRFAFCNGTVSNRDGVVARFNGTFYLPDHEGMRKEGAIEGNALTS